jgi:hypothetical protein
VFPMVYVYCILLTWQLRRLGPLGERVYLRRMRSLWTCLLGAPTVVVVGPPTCVCVCVSLL